MVGIAASPTKKAVKMLILNDCGVRIGLLLSAFQLRNADIAVSQPDLAGPIYFSIGRARSRE
jgi:hypothetical protein